MVPRVRTPGEVEVDLLAALRARDMPGVAALLAELAVVEPLHCQLILSVLDFSRPA